MPMITGFEHRRCTAGMGHAPILLAGALLLGIAVFVFFAMQSFGSGKPNIILISIDTLRHDRLGYAGHRAGPNQESPSPFIDRLAGEGTVFRHANSTSSWTLPGHYAMLTGLPDELHNMVDDRVRPDPKIRTMAQYLQERGYATGGFFSGPYLHRFFGFHRGFDMYESCMKEETVYDVMAFKGPELSPDALKEETALKEMKSHLEVTSREVTQKSLFFARTRRAKPLFLFLHYFDVHNDYIPPPPFNRRFDPDYDGWVTGHGVVRDPRIRPDMAEADLNRLKSLYDGEIAWVDRNIREFFEGLDAIDPAFLENSIVVVTSDHGEEFFEHGRIGHRGNVYAPTLRIPLLFWSRDLVPGGVRVDDPVRIYDIYPTILDLAGLGIPEAVFGRSLAPLLRGEPLTDEPLVAELTYLPSDARETRFYEKHFAYQLRNYKLVGYQKRAWDPSRSVDFTGEKLKERYELYDLDQDPNEKENLFDRQPKLAAGIWTGYLKEMERLKRRYRELHGTDAGTGLEEADDTPPELLEKIKQVGYIDGARDQTPKERTEKGK
jgi:arylsulfatase A-like enzyme